MREFEISENHEQSETVQEVVSDIFEDYEIDENNWLIVDGDIDDVLDSMKVKMKNGKLLLDINELEIDNINQDTMSNDIPRIIKAKNELLRRLTGYTVSDRKKKMRSDILPCEEWIEDEWKNV
jgi:hypothetical protein